jgi:hypothetical protein
LALNALQSKVNHPPWQSSNGSDPVVCRSRRGHPVALLGEDGGGGDVERTGGFWPYAIDYDQHYVENT